MTDWSWAGGRPCLDLVNTVRDRRTAPRELLATPADLAEWLLRAGLVEKIDGAAVTPAQLERARALRESVDRVVLARAGAADAELINGLVAVPPPARRLLVDRHGTPAVRPETGRDPVTSALGRVAGDVIALVAAGGVTVRVCASDLCGLRFEDRSPGRNRKWCSMRRCGNREKARQHYARTRPAQV